jgi:hypothetical protein
MNLKKMIWAKKQASVCGSKTKRYKDERNFVLEI